MEQGIGGAVLGSGGPEREHWASTKSTSAAATPERDPQVLEEEHSGRPLLAALVPE